MHQTSSRLLRMTDDDRPFTKDFEDLFSTLIVSLLPLSAHRVRLTKIEYTFLSEDAINNLSSLKFSQANRMRDPSNPSSIITTTITSTFSMAKGVARSTCQRFVEARLIESAGASPPRTRPQTDKLIHDQDTIDVIFRRFVSAGGPNFKSSVKPAGSDLLQDYRDGLGGVKMAAELMVNGKKYRDTRTGKATRDWLMDYSTVMDKRETVEVAALFVEYELVEPVAQDWTDMSQNPGCNIFQPTEYAIYQFMQRGRDFINGSGLRGRISEREVGAISQRNGITVGSSTQRLNEILNDPAVRLLFREQLRDTHCEENLSFYQDVHEFLPRCKAATRAAQKARHLNAMDSVKEIMAHAYGIYNAYLAPGSPCELNIDHQLRNNLATWMTKVVDWDIAMIYPLQEAMSLFEDAQTAVLELMASVSSAQRLPLSPTY
ncbi:Developmental regulator flbA [Fusarium oxysporum f. sp. conglutinans]|nr:Developmental regulator flbA [Fusarium oxysporum f. sp. conglutinans]